MKTKVYIDKGNPFVSLWPERLSDKSEVWNLHFRTGDSLPCVSEKAGDDALILIVAALTKATGERPLVL